MKTLTALAKPSANTWSRIMTDIQKVILDIFKHVDALCRKKGIAYYAIGGTCLGAVRHKGFIPWDDDLDIAIPIEDFDEFFKAAETELPEHLTTRLPRDVKRYPLMFGKIIDTRTTFIEDWEIGHEKAYKGVYVDVMPLSGVPAEGSEREKFIKEIKTDIRLNACRRGMGGSLKRLLMKAAMLPAMPFIPYHYYSDKLFNAYRSYPLALSEYTGYVWHAGVDRENLILPKKYFGTPVDLPFEDTVISCPEMYREYLSQQFGDYMTPPEHAARVGHSGIVDLDKPYSWYAEDKSRIKNVEK